MIDEKNKIELKWYTIRRVRLTREYVGGILAGFGGGVVTVASLTTVDSIRDYWVLIRLLGFMVLSVGAYMAFYAQDRYER
jgi:hypothetical protein